MNRIKSFESEVKAKTLTVEKRIPFHSNNFCDENCLFDYQMIENKEELLPESD